MNLKQVFIIKWRTNKLLTISLFFIVLGFSCQSSKPNKLRIATASSLNLVMRELANEYSKESNLACELIIGSSGKLAAQIMEGAPYDLFIAANMEYPQRVYEKGLSFKPKVAMIGKLVLWSASEVRMPSIDSLQYLKIKHIAIANPKIAPFGAVSLEALKKKEIFELIEEKLIYGESIAQVNQFILSESVEVGFTALSSVLSTKSKIKGFWQEVDEKLYSSLEHGAVVLVNNRGMDSSAIGFLNFLKSKKGNQILVEYGYKNNSNYKDLGLTAVKYD